MSCSSRAFYVGLVVELVWGRLARLVLYLPMWIIGILTPDVAVVILGGVYATMWFSNHVCSLTREVYGLLVHC